jgi:hypothetical protein
MIKSMRSAGSLLAIITVLVIMSALFAQVMARLTGLQLPAAAAQAPAAASLASSAIPDAAATNAGRSSANSAHAANNAAGTIASSTTSSAVNNSSASGASTQTVATAPAPSASDRSALMGALPAAATTDATHHSDAALNVAQASMSSTAGAATAPVASAPAAWSAASNAAMEAATMKAAIRASQPISAQNLPRASARQFEVAMRSAPDAPARVAVAPSPEQLRAAQCRTLQGYEEELVAQMAGGAAAADTPSRSGLREQLVITRARRLELDC